MSQSIVKQPWEFACKWYDVDSIHRSITRTESMRQLGDMPTIPHDVQSREFAEWLADQYRLAMQKGAELASQELQESIKQFELYFATVSKGKKTGEWNR
jgi:hypothetical protein